MVLAQDFNHSHVFISPFQGEHFRIIFYRGLAPTAINIKPLRGSFTNWLAVVKSALIICYSMDLRATNKSHNGVLRKNPFYFCIIKSTFYILLKAWLLNPYTLYLIPFSSRL